MGHAREEQGFYLFENGLEGFPPEGRFWRQQRADLAGADLGQHREGFDALVVVGELVHHGPAIPPEFFRGHVIGQF